MPHEWGDVVRGTMVPPNDHVTVRECVCGAAWWSDRPEPTWPCPGIPIELAPGVPRQPAQCKTCGARCRCECRAAPAIIDH